MLKNIDENVLSKQKEIVTLRHLISINYCLLKKKYGKIIYPRIEKNLNNIENDKKIKKLQQNTERTVLSEIQGAIKNVYFNNHINDCTYLREKSKAHYNKDNTKIIYPKFQWQDKLSTEGMMRLIMLQYESILIAEDNAENYRKTVEDIQNLRSYQIFSGDNNFLQEVKLTKTVKDKFTNSEIENIDYLKELFAKNIKGISSSYNLSQKELDEQISKITDYYANFDFSKYNKASLIKSYFEEKEEEQEVGIDVNLHEVLYKSPSGPYHTKSGIVVEEPQFSVEDDENEEILLPTNRFKNVNKIVNNSQNMHKQRKVEKKVSSDQSEKDEQPFLPGFDL